MPSTETEPPRPAPPEAAPPRADLAVPATFFARYVRPNRYFLTLACLFLVAGVVFAHVYFPSMSNTKATFGGAVLGLFFAGCCGSHARIWHSS